MKHVIIYATRKGYTGECAERLKQRIGESAELLDIGRKKRADLSPYDGVIIGGSIRASQLDRRVKTFLRLHQEELLGKPLLGLFLCSLEQQQWQELLNQHVPKAVIDHASAVGWFGGRIDLSQFSPPMRFLLKKVTKSSESMFREQREHIETFADAYLKEMGRLVTPSVNGAEGGA